MTLPPLDLRARAEQVMAENGFEAEFSPAVMEQVGRLAEPSPSAMPPGITDLTALPWSSIDNDESRDLDQVEVAVRNPDGSIRVSVGVADVATLVQLGSAADEHAANNTTSVYTGVATFPMLPERLSTDLTSLNQGEDRYAVVVSFDVAADGSLSNCDVVRALVHNRAKLTYEAVGAWLEGDGPVPGPLAASGALADQVRLQDEAALRLRSARQQAGALDFESVEANPVVVDGRIVDLAVVKRNRARDLIEDFMVAANRSVATYLLEHGSPSLRRVVREPRRWDRIVKIAADLGETLPDQPDSVALSQFMARRREADPEHFPDLSLSIVKLLGPGVYALERRTDRDADFGHFGLAVADYVHSTAPNRRFADLVTQRMLYAVQMRANQPYTDAQLEDIAARCTERADAARKVERTVRKIAGAVMMADRVGDSFTAVITAAAPKGTYARLLHPPVEGRVVSGGRGLDVGDTVRVTLVSVDPDKGFIDFAHTNGETPRKLERSRRKKIAAQRLRGSIGKVFEAEVTGVSESGTYMRLLDGSAEGRVMRGFKSLKVGMKVPVRLISTDSVHGFIDFEYENPAESGKRDRLARKRDAARKLRFRIGAQFTVKVTGVTDKAVWVETVPEKIEGRLVRGWKGARLGDRFNAILLRADPVNGFIDFAHEGAALPISSGRKPRRP
jgi:exoribonuclease-2